MARGRPCNDNEQREKEWSQNYFLGLIGSIKKIEDIRYINRPHGNCLKQ